MYFPDDNLDYKLTIAKKQGIITRVFINTVTRKTEVRDIQCRNF